LLKASPVALSSSDNCFVFNLASAIFSLLAFAKALAFARAEDDFVDFAFALGFFVFSGGAFSASL
jgi:hypothetical protein